MIALLPVAEASAFNEPPAIGKTAAIGELETNKPATLSSRFSKSTGAPVREL
jgi:hypothetical protein